MQAFWNEDGDIFTILIELFNVVLIWSIMWDDEFILIPYSEKMKHTTIWNWLWFAWYFEIVTRD